MVEEFLEIITKLGIAGYSILDKEYISKPLSFELKYSSCSFSVSIIVFHRASFAIIATGANRLI